MTTTAASAWTLVGRILLAIMFIADAHYKLTNTPAAMAQATNAGVPPVLVYPFMVMEFVCGVALIVGWQTRVAAIALAAFCLFTGIVCHYLLAQGLTGPEYQAQMAHFYKRLAIAGGLFVLMAHGAMAWSLDAWLERRHHPLAA